MNDLSLIKLLSRLNIEGLDLNEKYSIHFNYQGEFNLSTKDLELLLHSLDSICKRKFDVNHIQIKKINSGSLELFIQVFNVAVDSTQAVFATAEGLKFIEFLINALKIWRSGEPTETKLEENNIDVSDAENYLNIINNVSKNSDNRLEINIYQGDVTQNIFTLNGNEAEQVKKKANNYLRELKKPSFTSKKNLSFKFYSINHEIDTGLTDRISIDSKIHDKVVKVKYTDMSIKEEILQLDENIFNLEFISNAFLEYRSGKLYQVIVNEIIDVINSPGDRT